MKGIERRTLKKRIIALRREAERRNALREVDRQNRPRSELSKERSRSGVA